MTPEEQAQFDRGWDYMECERGYEPVDTEDLALWAEEDALADVHAEAADSGAWDEEGEAA